ncbi:hypothetical protein FJT64_019335 [Amphibalanus amphitrite]|uniref:Uncharacterized protein n=1 Tax=Amphibalanus amphitrite TaxID=1232801 RepID=A0A6A4WPX3_AMPAM|nr:hypothetical protein FJT64_019335 [Amphibalanus amphitrite]
MAISRGESPRSRWLLKLLISLVLIGAVMGRPSGQPAVCGRSCCSVLPSCVDAKKVTCDCPHMDEMVLRRGDIPSTAQGVAIRNTRHVILEEDAIGDLSSLVNLTVSDVGQLEIRRDGMASHNQTRLRSVLFQSIQSLQAQSHSFTGIWQTETAVRMQLIKELHVMSNAFSYQAIETGPRIPESRHSNRPFTDRTGACRACIERRTLIGRRSRGNP